MLHCEREINFSFAKLTWARIHAWSGSEQVVWKWPQVKVAMLDSANDSVRRLKAALAAAEAAKATTRGEACAAARVAEDAEAQLAEREAETTDIQCAPSRDAEVVVYVNSDVARSACIITEGDGSALVPLATVSPSGSALTLDEA